eukprot:scaffold92701_cov26-Tisochrysis_lutea.AAC.2
MDGVTDRAVPHKKKSCRVVELRALCQARHWIRGAHSLRSACKFSFLAIDGLLLRFSDEPAPDFTILLVSHTRPRAGQGALCSN